MMNRGRSVKKNKNAAVQYSTPAGATGTAAEAEDRGTGAKATSVDEPSFTCQDWSRGPDGRLEGSNNAASNTQPSFSQAQHSHNLRQTKSALSYEKAGRSGAQDTAIRDHNSLEGGFHEFNDTAYAVTGDQLEQMESRDDVQQDGTSLTQETDSSTNPWPGSKLDQAESAEFEKTYHAENKNDANEIYNNFHSRSSPYVASVRDTATWPSQSSSNGVKDNREHNYVDEPMEAYQSHQSGQWNPFGQEEATSRNWTDAGKEDQKKKYEFHDVQSSFMAEETELPENTHIHKCGHGQSHIVHNCCGRVVKTCPHIHQAGHKADDVFDHPEWQFLGDYSDAIGTGTSIPPVKPALKKSAKAGVAGVSAEGGGATGGGASKKQSGVTKGLPSRYYETNATLGDLVLDEGLVVKEVLPDGNCLFAAVVDQLRIRGEFYYTTKTLREAAVSYLRENPFQEDGTPLKMFLTEHDGTWDQYLTRMSREGEWGDHFVISALATVLKRRLVILRGISTKLTRTTMEPSKPHRSHAEPTSPITDSGTIQEDSNKDSGVDETAEMDEGVEEGPDLDDLYLGHIAEAHYVSLRQYDWEDRLQQSLKERKIPSFLQYGPAEEKDKKQKEKKDKSEKQDGGDIQMLFAFPEAHLDFLLKYIKNGYFIDWASVPTACNRKEKKDKMCEVYTLGDVFNGLEAGGMFGRRMQQLRSRKTLNKHGSQAEAEQSSWDSLDVDFYYVPNDTSVHSPDDKNVSPKNKDLLAIETDCEMGFTRLNPVIDILWFCATEEFDDKMYLTHLHLFDENRSETTPINVPKLAFKCSWPKCAEEFLSRKRASNWPSDSYLGILKKQGALVIPEGGQDSICPELVWKFSFKKAEQMLCLRLGIHRRHGYYYLRNVCEFLFEDKQFQFKHKDAVCKQELKTVFFYTCEEIPMQKFEDQPGFCLLYMLEKLRGYLEQKFLPDYFIRGVNLIADVEEHVLKWHAEQLKWFQEYVLENIFLLFDRREIMNHFGLGKCLETLITDARNFVTHRNLAISYSDCFLSLNILCIQNWVKIQRFDKAKELFVSTLKECTVYNESLDASQEILQKAIEDLPLQEKWLFAFCMDLTMRTNLLPVVCKDHECVQLVNVFGEACITALVHQSKIEPESFRVPMSIIYSENVVALAESFTKILRDQDKDVEAFMEASKFFLKTNTRDLLLSIEKEQKDENYHTGHDNTKLKLYSMFKALYDEYDYEERWKEFRYIMEEYDLLSRHYQHATLNMHTAKMWKFFHDNEKYDEAMARYRSIMC